MLYLSTGVRGAEVVDAAEVERRYGSRPSWSRTSSRCGATLRRAAGAKGIGEKTAADLLRRHGSLEGAIAGALREARPRRAGRCATQADELRAFKDIATLRRARA